MKMNSESYYPLSVLNRPHRAPGLFPVITAVIIVCLFLGTVSAAPTTAVHVVKYAADGTTVISERTVDFQWMEANLPVQGDELQGPGCRKRYGYQGPLQPYRGHGTR
jgi:hypothetical protein